MSEDKNPSGIVRYLVEILAISAGKGRNGSPQSLSMDGQDRGKFVYEFFKILTVLQNLKKEAAFI